MFTKQSNTDTILNNIAGLLYYNGEFYDLFENNSTTRARQEKDILFWLNIAKQYGDSILELGCGTGRITIPLIEAGFNVTGLDISESMLSLAKIKSNKVKWIQGDACDFDLADKFKLIIFPFNGMLHIHPDRIKSFLALLRSILSQLESL